MAILKMNAVKKIIKEHDKQATKGFLKVLDDKVNRQIHETVSGSRRKRLLEADAH